MYKRVVHANKLYGYNIILIHMSKLKKTKKELDKEFERIQVVGEGSVDDAKKILEEEKKESDLKRDLVLEELGKASKTTFKNYYSLLAQLLTGRIMLNVKFPEGWSFESRRTSEGVALELYGPEKKIYRLAFKPSGLKEYDLNAIDVYTMRVENTIYQYEKRRHQAFSNTSKIIS